MDDAGDLPVARAAYDHAYAELQRIRAELAEVESGQVNSLRERDFCYVSGRLEKADPQPGELAELMKRCHNQ